MTVEVQAAMKDIDTTMEKINTGKVKTQYQTAWKGPTKKEAHKNFMLGIIDKGYEEEWQ